MTDDWRGMADMLRKKGGVTDVRVDEACSQSCGLGSWRRGGTGYLCLGHVLAW